MSVRLGSRTQAHSGPGVLVYFRLRGQVWVWTKKGNVPVPSARSRWRLGPSGRTPGSNLSGRDPKESDLRSPEPPPSLKAPMHKLADRPRNNLGPHFQNWTEGIRRHSFRYQFCSRRKDSFDSPVVDKGVSDLFNKFIGGALRLQNGALPPFKECDESFSVRCNTSLIKKNENPIRSVWTE